MMITGYLNVRDAATRLGVTPGRVRQMLIANEIRGKLVNPRAWLISVAEVERVQRRREKSGR